MQAGLSPSVSHEGLPAHLLFTILLEKRLCFRRDVDAAGVPVLRRAFIDSALRRIEQSTFDGEDTLVQIDAAPFQAHYLSATTAGVDQQIKVELFEKGYNCCQIIAVYLAPVCGFDAEEIKESFNIMCDTCGGTCSTLRGGTYCLTAWAKKQGYDHDQTRALVDRLYDAFREKHGGILCKEIAKNDLMVCAGFVDTVVELTKQLIAEGKTA